MPAAGPIIGAIGSVAGGAMQSNAAGNAANAQVQAGRDAINAQLAMFNQSRADTLPYQATGVGALNMLAQMYGLPTYAGGVGGGGISVTGGEPTPAKKRTLFDKFTDPANLAGQFGGTSYDPMGLFGKSGQGTTPLQFNIAGNSGASGTGAATAGSGVPNLAAFYQTPDFLVARDEALQGLDRTSAARGRLFSGGADADRMRLASNLGSSAFGNFTNNLMRIAGLGGQANNTLTSLGQNTANQVGNSMWNAGQARASGYANQSNAWGNAFGDAASSLGQLWGNRQGSSPSYGGTTQWGAFGPGSYGWKGV